MLLALVATVALGTLQAAPASAYTVRKNGSPGKVVGYQVQGSHWDTCPTTAYSCFSPWVVGSGPVVYRSPASTGKQGIVAVYRLQRWNGSAWAHQADRTHVRYLPRGDNRLRMPRVDFLPNAAGYFRVIVGIAWGNADGTRSFGAKVLKYNQAGDYSCNTRFPCEAGAGYVWLRSPGV